MQYACLVHYKISYWWRRFSIRSTYIPFTIKIPTTDTETFEFNMGKVYFVFTICKPSASMYTSIDACIHRWPSALLKVLFSTVCLILVFILFYVQHDPENGKYRNSLSYLFVIDIYVIDVLLLKSLLNFKAYYIFAYLCSL